jgi:GDPmannose 4,6-dehydratase
MNNKNIIITGITGQDGSYMVDFLLKNTNYNIIGIRRRSSNPNLENIKHNIDNPRLKIIIADLSDSNSIDEIVKEIKPDYFINFAAQSFVGSSWQIPLQTFDVVALGVLRCLEAIRKYAPECRFYSAGSSEEMGDVVYSPQDLKHPIRPRSPYGAAKASARHITKVYRESYNLYAIHSILYNHESERRGEEFVTRKITKNVARIINSLNKNIPFDPMELGNLESKRDWSHAEDFIEGIWLMLNQNTPKEYILSSGKTHSIKEFVEKSFYYAGLTELYWKGENENSELLLPDYLLKEGNVKSKVLVKINPKYYRPAEVDLLLGDSSLAEKELNWKPKISFDSLVERMTIYDIHKYEIN